jgi:putative spermidine/putrescine transport system substrate-binding protein
MDDFRAGNANVGTTWQIITNLLKGETPPVKVDVIKPTEGANGWSDTRMINSKTKNPGNAPMPTIDYLTVAGDQREDRGMVRRRRQGIPKSCA